MPNFGENLIFSTVRDAKKALYKNACIFWIYAWKHLKFQYVSQKRYPFKELHSFWNTLTKKVPLRTDTTNPEVTTQSYMWNSP